MSDSEKRPDKFWLVFGLVALCFVLVAAPIALCAGLILPALQKARAAAMQQQIQAEEDAREAAEAAAKERHQAAGAGPTAPENSAPENSAPENSAPENSAPASGE